MQPIKFNMNSCEGILYDFSTAAFAEHFNFSHSGYRHKLASHVHMSEHRLVFCAGDRKKQTAEDLDYLSKTLFLLFDINFISLVSFNFFAL